MIGFRLLLVAVVATLLVLASAIKGRATDEHQQQQLKSDEELAPSKGGALAEGPRAYEQAKGAPELPRERDSLPKGYEAPRASGNAERKGGERKAAPAPAAAPKAATKTLAATSTKGLDREQKREEQREYKQEKLVEYKQEQLEQLPKQMEEQQRDHTEQREYKQQQLQDDITEYRYEKQQRQEDERFEEQQQQEQQRHQELSHELVEEQVREDRLPKAQLPAVKGYSQRPIEQQRTEQAPEGWAEPYAFQYDNEGSSRRESGDTNGVVRGQYTLRSADGGQRIVDYVADRDGFRATVETNEFGTEARSPAAVSLRSSQPLAEKITRQVEASRTKELSAPKSANSATKRYVTPEAPAQRKLASPSTLVAPVSARSSVVAPDTSAYDAPVSTVVESTAELTDASDTFEPVVEARSLSLSSSPVASFESAHRRPSGAGAVTHRRTVSRVVPVTTSAARHVNLHAPAVHITRGAPIVHPEHTFH
ncbi:hypothetical protein GZH46_02499, partial [Fragariocoptes setiger]